MTSVPRSISLPLEEELNPRSVLWAVGTLRREASEGTATLGSQTSSLQDREDTLLLSKPPCLPCFVMVAPAPNTGPFQRGHREEGALVSILY